MSTEQKQGNIYKVDSCQQEDYLTNVRTRYFDQFVHFSDLRPRSDFDDRIANIQ